MEDHPQIKAFNEAASMLCAERYWAYGLQDEYIEFLPTLGEALTEVCYPLDANGFCWMWGRAWWLPGSGFCPCARV